jgi:predicted outer membrane protein
MKKLVCTIFFFIGLYFIIGLECVLADIPVQHSDAEVLGVLSVIDQNEIQAAQLAEQKTIDQRVLDYARTLDVECNQHLDHTRHISQELGMTLEDNASLDQLRAQGTEDLAALTALDAGDFARLYLEDMIKGYSEALNWMDIQNTNNEHVKEFLKETRRRLVMHLEKASKMQANVHSHFIFS